MKEKRLKIVYKYAKISDLPFNQRYLIHQKLWFPQCFVGPRIPKKLIFLKNRKKNIENAKTQTVQKYAKISNMPFNQWSLIHREVWFPPCFVRQNQPEKNIFSVWRFQTFSKLKYSNLRSLLSESLKIWDIQLQEVGAKIGLNCTLKVNTHTDRQTDGQIDCLLKTKKKKKNVLNTSKNKACCAGCRHRPFPMQLHQLTKSTPSVKQP